MATRDNLKLYYSIGEVARELGVEVTTLRYWEKRFPQFTPKRAANGRRQYTRDHLQGFRQVHHLLRVEGVSIEHAQSRLKHMGDPEQKRIEALSRLHRMRGILTELRDLL